MTFTESMRVACNGNSVIGVGLRRQRGATFLGMLIIISIVGVAVYAGIRLFPIYKEYFDVLQAMSQTSKSLGEGAGVQEIRGALAKRWQIEDIRSLEPTEIQVNRVGDNTVMRAQYQAEAPFIGNVFLIVKFDKSVKMGQSASP